MANISGGNELTIDLLTKEDIPFAMEVKNLAKWNQLSQDWDAYLEYEPNGCFLAKVDGEEAGTATTISYENKFGWVGMVLVHPSKRRLGIGTSLLEQCIEYLQQSGIDCVRLDATPMGREVYLKMGFVDEYELRRFQGSSPVQKGDSQKYSDISPIISEDITKINEFDQDYFGASRPHVLNALLNRQSDLCFYAQKDGKVTGYIMARSGYDAYQIGPWVADDAETAEKLLYTIFEQLPGETIFLDVPLINESGVKLMEKYNFTIQRELIRMHLGENKYPGKPQGIFAASSAEKG